MGTRVFDQTVFIANNDTSNVTTSSDYHSLTILGDTLQIVTPRSILPSTSTGNVGELCVGSQTVLGITTYYLYYCYSPNHWVRANFTAF